MPSFRGLSLSWHCNREHSAAVASSPSRLGAISTLSVNVGEVFVPTGKELLRTCLPHWVEYSQLPAAPDLQDPPEAALRGAVALGSKRPVEQAGLLIAAFNCGHVLRCRHTSK